MRLNEAFHAAVVILFLYLSKMQQSPGRTRSGPPHVTASCVCPGMHAALWASRNIAQLTASTQLHGQIRDNVFFFLLECLNP